VPRVPLVSPDVLPAERRGDLPRALANAPKLAGHVEALYAALYETSLDPQLRELAILVAARATGASYVYDRHWNYGLRTGLSREQLRSVESFEGSDLYSEEQRAAMRYAREATVAVEVSPGTWAAVAALLDAEQLVELTLTVAFYNLLARFVVPLEIETEEWYELG
jgi:alkylhydroperoxidase family enzyme